MLLRKEFYFVRHGQTDQNLSTIKTDHADISLNDTGRGQALHVAPFISQLPIQNVFCSPLKRAKETAELLIPHRSHQETDYLGECTAEIWNSMTSLGKNAFDKGPSNVKDFLERVKNGLNQALDHPGPILIVSHGGVHWAICYWMNITDHHWIIDNCKPVHFFHHQAQNHWKANVFCRSL